MQLRIRELMKKSGLKQVDLAESVGITEGYLSNLLSGRREPSPSMLAKIASELGVTVPEIFGDYAGNVPGLHEDQAVFVQASATHLRQLCRALNADCAAPALYKVNNPAQAFGILDSDMLLVDLKDIDAVGESLVLATTADHKTGSAKTEIHRRSGHWLFNHAFGITPIDLNKRNDTAIMARVAAKFRTY